MRVKQARDAARQWVVEEASGLLGFCGAYATGSTNWLPDDADLPTTSNFDIMVVLTDPNPAGKRSKFIYRDILLEISPVAARHLVGNSVSHERGSVMAVNLVSPEWR